MGKYGNFHSQSNCSVHGVVVYQSNHTHASEKYDFLHSFATVSHEKNPLTFHDGIGLDDLLLDP